MTDDPARELTPEERTYVGDVSWRLRGLPRALRRSLLQTLRQNLTERPPCDSRPDLERDLGRPMDYANDLLTDADLAEPGSIARARRRGRVRRTWLAVAVVAVVAAVALGYRWWVTWDPGLAAPMERVCAGSDGENCDQTGFVEVPMAEAVQVPCRRNGELFVTLGLSSNETVTVTGASVPGIPSVDDPMMSDQFLWLQDVQPWQRPDPSQRAVASHWPITVGPDGMLPELHLHFTLCRSGPHDPGSGQSIETIQLHYRALGRDRTATIAIPQTVAVLVPPFD